MLSLELSYPLMNHCEHAFRLHHPKEAPSVVENRWQDETATLVGIDSTREPVGLIVACQMSRLDQAEY